MLQCSFSLAAAQLVVKMTFELQKSECCSAVSAAQLSENCSATSIFRLWHVAGVGFEGWGLGLADQNNFADMGVSDLPLRPKLLHKILSKKTLAQLVL